MHQAVRLFQFGRFISYIRASGILAALLLTGQAQAQWEVTLGANASLNDGADLGSIANSGGTGTRADPYLYTFTTGGLNLQGYKVSTKTDAEDPRGTSFTLNMGGHSVTGQSETLSFDTVTDASSWEGCGWVTITNVGSVNIGAIETHTTKGRSYPGYVRIGEADLPATGHIRIDHITAYSTVLGSSGGYGGADIKIYGSGDVLIQTEAGMAGDLHAFSYSLRSRPIEVIHDGAFRANDISNYWYSTSFGNYNSAGGVTLRGNATGAPNGSCVIRNIDTHLEGAESQKWFGDGGHVTISGYTSVTLNDVITYHLTRHGNSGTPTGGYLTVTNITGNIDITGAINLDAINTYGDPVADGILTLQCGGDIMLADLDLTKILHACLEAGGKSTITGAIIGTDGGAATPATVSTLRAPVNKVVFYDPALNPGLGGESVALNQLDGMAGGGTLKPLVPAGTMILFK